MDALRHLPRIFQSAAPPDSLSSMPTELIQAIALFLQPHDIACLSLTNRRLRAILGYNLKVSLSIGKDERKTFLLQLARDLPQYRVCFPCRKLHRSSRVLWPGRILEKSDDCPMLGNRYYNLRKFHPGSSYSLNFAHVQEALKHHRLNGLHGIPIEAFNSTEVKMVEEPSPSTWLLSVDAQICSEELIVRSQLWILVPRSKMKSLADSMFIQLVCQHIRSTQGLGEFSSWEKLVRLHVTNLKRGISSPNLTYQCRKCHLQFQLEAVDFGSPGAALVLTRWVNVGGGESPDDPIWESHCSQGGRWPVREARAETVQAIKTIKLRFEAETTVKVDELTAINVVRLFAKRENKMFSTDASGCVWQRHMESTWFLTTPEEEKKQKRETEGFWTVQKSIWQ